MTFNQAKQHIPNALSIFRLGIGVSFLFLCFNWNANSILAAQVLAVIGVVSDKLDGTLARFWNVESDLGKRLESFADPLFATCLGVFVFVTIGLPQAFIVAALTYLIIGMVGRILVSLIRKELFYEKSQITRYGVGFVFVLFLFFLFGLPYRVELSWVAIVYGAFMCANYVRMEIQFLLKK